MPSIETILAAAGSAVAALSGVASLGWWLAGRFTKQDRYFGKLLDEHAKEDRAMFEKVSRDLDQHEKDEREKLDEHNTRIMRLELTANGQTHSGRFPRR